MRLFHLIIVFEASHKQHTTSVSYVNYAHITGHSYVQLAKEVCHVVVVKTWRALAVVTRRPDPECVRAAEGLSGLGLVELVARQHAVSIRVVPVEQPFKYSISDMLRHLYGNIHLMTATTSYNRKCGFKRRDMGGHRHDTLHCSPCKVD